MVEKRLKINCSIVLNIFKYALKEDCHNSGELWSVVYASPYLNFINSSIHIFFQYSGFYITPTPPHD